MVELRKRFQKMSKVTPLMTDGARPHFPKISLTFAQELYICIDFK